MTHPPILPHRRDTPQLSPLPALPALPAMEDPQPPTTTAAPDFFARTATRPLQTLGRRAAEAREDALARGFCRGSRRLGLVVEAYVLEEIGVFCAGSLVVIVRMLFFFLFEVVGHKRVVA